MTPKFKVGQKVRIKPGAVKGFPYVITEGIVTISEIRYIPPGEIRYFIDESIYIYKEEYFMCRSLKLKRILDDTKI